MAKLARFTFNHFGTNCYILSDQEGKALVVDPCFTTQGEAAKLTEYIAANHLGPAMVALTHPHPDHIAGVAELKKLYNIPLAIHSADSQMLAIAPAYGAQMGFNIAPVEAEIDLAKEKMLEIGSLLIEVIHTPGHSQGGVCFYDAEGGILLSGDTLFAGSIGRSDLMGGDYDQLMSSIIEKILPLGGGVKVYPGHGGETTIGQEMGTNPFIGEVLDGGFNKDTTL